MSREIKFRAWDKIFRRWMTVTETSRALSYANMYSASEDIELMQYTGLKDKNGTLIFEGDIVECTGNNPRKNEHYRGEVTYGTDIVTAGFSIGSVGWYKKEVEVVGNRFEHPELLTTNTPEGKERG